MRHMRKIEVVKALRDQEEEWYIEPTLKDGDKKFHYRCAYNASIRMIINEIRDSDQSPIVTVENFNSRIYKWLKENPHLQDMYVASIDASDHILDLLNAMDV